MRSMEKTTALALLGGTVAAAAKALDCTTQAVYKWPESGPLPRAIAARVIAAHVRLRAEKRAKHRAKLELYEQAAMSL